MLRKLRDHSLTIALMTLFAASIVGQWLTGWRAALHELARHDEPPISLWAYTGDAAFLSAVFENWESEFLQMGVYVFLTAWLFQRGSAESRDPDDPTRPNDEAPAAWPAFKRRLYENSLPLVLGALFVASFALHALESAEAAAQEALDHGEAPPTRSAHLWSSLLWFESFQNWQSEFLSTATLIVLSIFLRQKGSPESKPVGAEHRDTGAE
jgi:hypothetical protein